MAKNVKTALNGKVRPIPNPLPFLCKIAFSLTVLVKTSQAPSLFQFSLSFAWQCFISCLGAALHRDVYISQDQIL